MSKSKGEGRSSGEKGQRLLNTVVTRGQLEKKRKQEEEEWAAKCGPVTVRKIGDPK